MSTANTQHYDVIIAGARCAGAATALLLARQGARVLVLDKSRYGTDTLACVFAATSAERLRREPDRGADAAWRRILGRAAPGLAERLDHCGAAGPPRVFPGLTGYLREAAGPGWALVGDAGYFKDPITAHGITDALRDAEILARVIASGGSDAVRRYQAERDELSLRLFRVTGRIASFDWTGEEVGGHLLELGEAMAEETVAMTAGAPGLRLELASA
jgi:flavin-dependent dehydrogenase